ncbi:hypothetical protein CRUP_012686 [Coryphaenoides rupestris]|nr:hypothetical protein CRUP_012686 [Coryphaenoides rupestris]
MDCPGTENKALAPMRHAFPTDQFADGQEEGRHDPTAATNCEKEVSCTPQLTCETERNQGVTPPPPAISNQMDCPGTENKALAPMRHAFPTDQFADGQEEGEEN